MGSLGNYLRQACAVLALGSFRSLANLAAFVTYDPLRETHGEIGFTFDLFNPILPAGITLGITGLISAKETERAAYKARLEASGYVVLDEPAALPEIFIEKSS